MLKKIVRHVETAPKEKRFCVDETKGYILPHKAAIVGKRLKTYTLI